MNGITLYTQPGCGPCIGLKAKLKRDNREFVEINVQENPDALTRVKELGYTGTPVLEYTDLDGEHQHFHGYRSDILEDVKKAEQALTAA